MEIYQIIRIFASQEFVVGSLFALSRPIFQVEEEK